MGVFYEIGLRLYFLLVLVTSIFQKKAKQWISGRKGIFKAIKTNIDNSSPIAWFHSASLGEFEQGRPLIEEFKFKYPEYKILITFYSPSGYEIRKNYAEADFVYYLPLDTKKNAKKFVKLVKPKIAFFIKYEFWPNYLKQLYQNRIPTFLVSGIFRKNQIFFKKQGKWFKKMLEYFNYLFVQDSDSYNLMRNININNVSIAGDTRFDRVYKNAKTDINLPEIELFKNGKIIFIAGSSWPADDDLVVKFINENNFDIKYIIAPHEISKSHINNLENIINKKVLKYSERTDDKLIEANVLIIDSIGKLSSIYKYANIAYIGGGFGKGIHNILEAATFGMPVIFGPNHKKFREAINLIENGGAFPINNYNELNKILSNFLNNTEEINNTGRISKNYVIRNKGVVKTIMNTINNYIS